jgi:AraC-like DNA-binding protein
LVQEKVDDLVARVGDDFPGQVREVLHVALNGGRSDLDYIASLFALHPRTLRRRLAASGSSYQSLLDQVRCDLARDMLSSTELDVSELALMLHYSDARAFIRAFRRWNGKTPARWRKENRSR